MLNITTLLSLFLTYLIDLSNQVASGQLNNEINRTVITRDFVSSLPKEIRNQISQDTLTFLNENKYDYATYPKDDSKIANEIRLLQEQQFRRNSTDIFESLMTYAFNQTPTMPKKEIPEAFRESTSVFSGTNPIR